MWDWARSCHSAVAFRRAHSHSHSHSHFSQSAVKNLFIYDPLKTTSKPNWVELKLDLFHSLVSLLECEVHLFSYESNVHPLCINSRNSIESRIRRATHGRSSAIWGECFVRANFIVHLAALGVNNNHKDVTITHWNRFESESEPMCDVNGTKVPTDTELTEERARRRSIEECWTIVELVFRRVFFILRPPNFGPYVPTMRNFCVRQMKIEMEMAMEMEMGSHQMSCARKLF